MAPSTSNSTATVEALHRLYCAVLADPRYATGITYGKPRQGHQEGTVAAHIIQLEANLARLRPLINSEQYWKLMVLIHTHDTFKYWASRDVSILDRQSHASLAKTFLAEFTDDEDLLRMVQFHDENWALYKQFAQRGHYNEQRFCANILPIRDLELFLLFTILDGFTPSKEEIYISMRWFVGEVKKAICTSNQRVCLPLVYEALELFGL